MESSLLRVGATYSYKGKLLTYYHCVPNFYPKFIFLNERGTQITLSQNKLTNEVYAIAPVPTDCDRLNSPNSKEKEVT
jgi:hypothetical protein